MNHTEYMAGWRERNRERVREINRNSYRKHAAVRNARTRKYYAENRDAIRAQVKLYREKNKEKIRASTAYHTRKRRGQVEAPTRPMPEVCEMNGCVPGKRRLHEDHDHVTGKFRGWICSNCNTGMGNLRDDIKKLQAAILWLQRGGPA